MATKTTGKTGTIVSDLTVDPKSLSLAQRRQAAIDKWQSLDERVSDLSKKRLTARDEALALGTHGKTYAASDGTQFLFVDDESEVRKHEKVVQALAAKLGLTEKQLAAEYAKTMGSRRTRDIKKV